MLHKRRQGNNYQQMFDKETKKKHKIKRPAYFHFCFAQSLLAKQIFNSTHTGLLFESSTLKKIFIS